VGWLDRLRPSRGGCVVVPRDAAIVNQRLLYSMAKASLRLLEFVPMFDDPRTHYESIEFIKSVRTSLLHSVIFRIIMAVLTGIIPLAGAMVSFFVGSYLFAIFFLIISAAIVTSFAINLIPGNLLEENITISGNAVLLSGNQRT
jgi:hypothetical protein